MADFLVNAALLVLILGSSALLTNAFTRRMYLKCSDCGRLNAKRRSHCRICGHLLDP